MEEHFQHLWKRINDYHHAELVEKLINTQFYIHSLFRKISDDFRGNNKNNYNNLVQLADFYAKENPNEYILFVDFNYDLLLEEALTGELGYSFNTIDDYIDFKKRKMLLFKPHGSCNWVKKYNGSIFKEDAVIRDIKINSFAKELFNTHVSFPQLFDQLDNKIDILGPTYIDRYYPWLLLPYRDKDEFVMPETHNTVLTHFIKDIDEILIIGWKGTEDHFLKLLKLHLGAKQPKIVFVNGGDKSIKETFITHNGLFIDETKWVEFSGNTHNKDTFSSLMDWFVKTPPLFSK